MASRLSQAISTGLALCAGYLAYAAFVTPIFEPAVERSKPAAEASARVQPPRDSAELAQRHLPDEPWTQRAACQMRLGSAVIFAQERELNGTDAEIRFRPFALIDARPRESSDEPPLTIVCESASLKFANPFDARNPQPGRVIGATLEGRTVIRGPRGLHLSGRQFFFSEQALSLWSDRELHFAYDGVQGRAIGLQVDFRAHQDPEHPDLPAVGGIRSVRFRRQAALATVYRERRRPHADAARPADLVSVFSDGPLLFSPETSTATMEQRVRLYRRPLSVGAANESERLFDEELGQALAAEPEPQSSDWVLCERLTLLLSPASPLGRREEGPAAGDGRGLSSDPEDWLPRHLAFAGFRAEGSVSLALTSQEASGEMQSAVYEAATSRLTCSDPHRVRLVHRKDTLAAPKVIITLGPDGGIAEFDARGPGRLDSSWPGQPGGSYAVRWSKRLRQRPAGGAEPPAPTAVRAPRRAGGLVESVVELEGAVRLDSGTDCSIRAHAMSLWLQSNPLLPGDRSVPRGRSVAAGSGAARSTASDKNRFTLRKVVAVGDVEWESPEVVARTPWAEVVIVPGDVPEAADGGRGGRGGSGEAPGGSPRTGGGRREAAVPGRFDVRAGRIEASVIRGRQDASRFELQTVSAFDDVRIEHAPGAPGAPPATLTGSAFVVQNRGAEQTIHLAGRPAVVEHEGHRLEAGDLQWLRPANELVVTGSGLLQVPTSTSLFGEALDEPGQLEVRWQESMEFSGQTGVFRRGVRCRAADGELTCEEVTVRLSDSIRFLDPDVRGVAGNLRVTALACRHNVKFFNSQYRDGKLATIEQGSVDEFRADLDQGKTEAAGPGLIQTWRRGDGRRAGLHAPSSARANRMQRADAHEWEYAQVGFQGGMSGNFLDKFMTFDGEVQLVYGPVSRSSDVIDPDDLPSGGGWMRCKTLQVERITESMRNAAERSASAQRPTVEQAGGRGARRVESSLLPLGAPAVSPAQQRPDEFIKTLATGDVELAGTVQRDDGQERFGARADSISYDQSKQLYVLRSLGHHKATIRRQERPGMPVSRAAAQRIEFSPGRGSLKLYFTTDVEGLH